MPVIDPHWEKVNLGDVVSFRTGKLDSNAAVIGGKYPFFTCAQETYRTNTCAFDTECVLLGGNNANGVYPLKYFNGKFDAYQRTYLLEALNNKRLLIRFLFYVLRPKLLELQNISTGASTKFLTLTLLKQIQMSLPDLGTQERIVNVLAVYDDLIDNNSHRITILETIAQAIYTEWFVNLRFPGYRAVKMNNSKTDFKKLPEGWQIVQMKDIGEVIDCLHSKKPESVKTSGNILLQLYNVGTNGKLDLSEKYLISDSDYAEWTKRTTLREGDCVVTNVGRVAAVAQIPKAVQAALGRNMTGIRPEKIPSSYLIQYLLSAHMATEVQKKKDSGAIMDSLNVKGIYVLNLFLPPPKLLDRFDSVIAPLREEINLLVETNRHLRSIRDLLIPRVVTGEVAI